PISGSTATLALADGQTTATFTVTVGDDTTVEGNESVGVALGTCTGCALTSPSTATVTIIDNDTAPAGPAATIANISIKEGNTGTTTATFTITLSATAATDVTVQRSITGGTAASGSDYQAWSPSTRQVVVPAGQRMATFTVSVIGDKTMENDETVVVTITSVSGGTGTGNTGTLTILDDDRKLITSASGPGAAPVRSDDVSRVFAAAVALWQVQGADVSRLAGVRVVLAVLPDGELAEVQGSTIVLSGDAAGWGGSTDLGRAAAGRSDLLS